MSIEHDFEILENDGAEIPDWLAGIGTYGILTASNRLVQWLTSFFDMPPWAIVARDLLLVGSNIALSETFGRKMIKGSDVAIRVGYISASVQTLSAGLIGAWLKHNRVEPQKELPEAKNAEDAKKIYESLLLEKKKFDEKMVKAQQQLDKFFKPQLQEPANKSSIEDSSKQEVQSKNVSVNGLTSRLSRKSLMGYLG